MVNSNYKILKDNTNNSKLDKQKLIEKVEPINKRIREEDNILMDNYYDNIVNECLIDAANELIEKER